MKILATNRRALFDYDLLEHREAGLVLSGQEVKSAKTTGMSLKGAFITFSDTTPYLTNAHISPYKHAGELPDYDPTRPRKILLSKQEIVRMISKKQVEGLTIIPIKVYIARRGLIKVEIALGRGKKRFDKRHAISDRETKRNMERFMKEKNNR